VGARLEAPGPSADALTLDVTVRRTTLDGFAQAIAIYGSEGRPIIEQPGPECPERALIIGHQRSLTVENRAPTKPNGACRHFPS